MPRTPRLELLDAVAAMDVDVVRRVISGRPLVFLNGPDLIREVLVTRAASFEKSDFQQRVMGEAEGAGTGLGAGLLTSSNAVNRQQRALLGQVFSPAATTRCADRIAVLAREQRDRWCDGAVVEMTSALLPLVTRMVAETLFSWDVGPAAQGLAEDLDLIGDVLGRPLADRRSGWSDASRIEQAAGRIETGLLSLVVARRAGRQQTGVGDVVDVLLAAQVQDLARPADERCAQPITDAQIRDDLMTLFITGVENPRNALAWAVHLLSRHPQVARRIRAEVDEAGVADGAVTAQALGRLPFTLQVLKEVLRLYPPGYAFGRRAVDAVRVGPLRLMPGDEVVISPYALHRRPGLFERPYDFLPERFERPEDSRMSAGAYLPFGLGPRSCLGAGFALLLGQVTLAVLVGGLEFRAVSDAAVTPQPRMTLRPGGPISVSVQARSRRD